MDDFITDVRPRRANGETMSLASAIELNRNQVPPPFAKTSGYYDAIRNFLTVTIT